MFIITYTKQFLLVGLGIMVVSVLVLGVFGLNLGIDFTGGALTEVSYEERPQKERVEEALNELSFEESLGGYSLRASVDEEGQDAYILRTRDLAESERQKIHGTLEEQGGGADITRFTSIGPVIGEELKRKAVWAIGLVVLIVVLYVAWAFRGISKPVKSSRYGLITILALVHDVLVPAAVFAVLGVVAGAEVDVLFVMAILAVLGYSVNDTIVVFDRVRENILKNQEENRHMPFKETVGRSLSNVHAFDQYIGDDAVGSPRALLFWRGCHTEFCTRSDCGNHCRNILFALYCLPASGVDRRTSESTEGA